MDATITLTSAATSAAAGAAVQACVPVGRLMRRQQRRHILFTSTESGPKRFRHRRPQKRECVTASIPPRARHLRDFRRLPTPFDAVSLGTRQRSAGLRDATRPVIPPWRRCRYRAAPTKDAWPTVARSKSLTRPLGNAQDTCPNTYSTSAAHLYRCCTNNSLSFEPRLYSMR